MQDDTDKSVVDTLADKVDVDVLTASSASPGRSSFDHIFEQLDPLLVHTMVAPYALEAGVLGCCLLFYRLPSLDMLINQSQEL